MIFFLEIDLETWISENNNIEAEDLDLDSFSTELGYGNIAFKAEKENKSLTLLQIELPYLLMQIDYLLTKEKDFIQKKHTIKSMHQNFQLDFWAENEHFFISDTSKEEAITLTFEKNVFVESFNHLKTEFKQYLEKGYPNFKAIWKDIF